MNALARRAAYRVVTEYGNPECDRANADLILAAAREVQDGRCTALTALALCMLAAAIEECNQEERATAERDVLAAFCRPFQKGGAS